MLTQTTSHIKIILAVRDDEMYQFELRFLSIDISLRKNSYAVPKISTGKTKFYKNYTVMEVFVSQDKPYIVNFIKRLAKAKNKYIILPDLNTNPTKFLHAERFINMKMHPSITPERLIDATERRNHGLDNPGFCIFCGEEAEGVEPDACKYMCKSCGRTGVYGAEELCFILNL